LNQEINMQIRSWILWVVTVLCVPTLAFAHPGHGHSDPGSPTHYAVEPVHVIPVVFSIVAIVLAALSIYLVWRGHRDRR
jgi:hypothetical protein